MLRQLGGRMNDTRTAGIAEAADLRKDAMQQRNIIASGLGVLDAGDWSILLLSIIAIGLLAFIW
jgi:hypothetical protein